MVVGLTGGVGAGKSRILQLLRTEYGAETFQADQVARQLMEPGQPGYQQVVKALGIGFLDKRGRIDKEKLAQLIFGDPAALKAVNQIIHPLTWQQVENQASSAKASLVVVEFAILNPKYDDFFDEIWYVYTSEENRARRLKAGRGYSQEKILSIMASQQDEGYFRSHCHQVIDNNGTLDQVREQLASLLESKNVKMKDVAYETGKHC